MPFTSSDIQLVIFDCDGTLVDTEPLYNTITSELLTELGLEGYSPERCIELFGGLSWSTIKAKLENEHGPDLIPRDIIDRYIKTANTRMDQGLKTPHGAANFIETVKQTRKICVASNGERNNVIKSLQVTQLLPHFPDAHIFTKIQVERPKPARDLFLFTADKMGVEPKNCLVIEDSLSGVKAGVAANMNVIGFTGTAHKPDEAELVLKKAGAHHIASGFSGIFPLLSRGKQFS